uniref:Uncharacterized protein n=1 Tax=Arundo donax TaxID=35708 RepID=A0A0A9AJ27_ARUDO
MGITSTCSTDRCIKLTIRKHHLRHDFLIVHCFSSAIWH